MPPTDAIPGCQGEYEVRGKQQAPSVAVGLVQTSDYARLLLKCICRPSCLVDKIVDASIQLYAHCTL